ncbi:hypothetical protein ACQEVI_15795 [Promicromonospora sp. CA-289599]|uniref:hypothetical protein n=1 Tax=Promicromonospora sp. CA-289599 TaxID=3240014 RepID=UPI003D92A5A5
MTAVAAVAGGAVVAIIGDVQPHVGAQVVSCIAIALGSYAAIACGRAFRDARDRGERRSLLRMTRFGLAAVFLGSLGLIAAHLLV